MSMTPAPVRGVMLHAGWMSVVAARCARTEVGRGTGGTMAESIRQSARPSRSPSAALEFKLIFMVGFAFSFIGVVTARLAPWRWHAALRRAKGCKSVIEEARAATNRTIPFA